VNKGCFFFCLFNSLICPFTISTEAPGALSIFGALSGKP